MLANFDTRRVLPWMAALLLTLSACGGGGSETDAGMNPDGGECSVGEPGCLCDEGSCTTGECIDNMCVDCNPAEEGCICRSTGSCNAGLRCNADNLCEACPAGEDGCECLDGDVCNEGLTCTAGTCVDSTCTAGTLSCPCGDGDTCDEGLTCGAMNICEECADDVPGCPCTDGTTCTGGLLCGSDGNCRSPLSCEDLRGAGMCGMFQECTEGDGTTDATCVDMSCQADYRWDTASGDCVACVSVDCAEEPNCMGGTAGDISATCTAENRACEENVDGIGECTACLAGFTEVDGECRDVIACEDSDGDGTADVVCEDDEYCDATNPGGATCTAWPCMDTGMAEDTGGSCISCAGSCSGEGTTGRFWPFTDVFDQCICETLPGYFWDTGDLDEARCDADDDGYVRGEVRDLLDATAPDPAVLANARCDVRSVDRVILQDEYGSQSLIYSCDEGLLQDPDLGVVTCTPSPLRLFETKRNDVPSNPDLTTDSAAAPYESGGRRFAASELNSLTKACVSTLGDYDDDGFEDISQYQPRPSDTSALGEDARLRAFSHFVELYSQDYMAPGMGEDHGALIIAERSRCESSFSLGYGSDMGYDADDSSTYWRNCERRRDPGYDGDLTDPGYDFAQWGCDSRSGSCPAPELPASASESSFPDPESSLLRNHGLCELAGASPADMQFRGMNHHSQFKCVQIVANGAASEAFDREQSTFETSGTGTFNRCEVRDCAGAADCTDSVDPMAIEPWTPVFDCSPVTPGDVHSDGEVGWASIRYQPYDHVTVGGGTVGDTGYNGGCINEDAEYANICPSPEFGYCSSAAPDSFGRYRCYGWDSLFVWADDDATPTRSELVWAPDSGDASNMSVWNIEPSPAAACL